MHIEIWLGNSFKMPVLVLQTFFSSFFFLYLGLRTAERAVSSVAVHERCRPPSASEVRMKFSSGCTEISATTC